MRRFTVLFIAAIVGCGGSEPESTSNMLPGLHVDAVPENGFQIVLPVVQDLQPGESYEFCTWTDQFIEKDIDIKSAKGFQSETGHHVILFYTMVPKPAGTSRICEDSDMASFRFVVGTGGEGIESEAPGNLVYHIPAGAQLVANHHYLNGTGRVIEAQSAMNVRLAEPSPNNVRSGAVAFVDTSLRIPVGTPTMDIKCTIPRKMDMWVFSPHMHRWGRHINVDLVRSGKPESLFDLNWDPEYTFHPPEIRKDLSDPFTLLEGDQVNVHCAWDNTTGKELTFGLEMCVAFGQTIDTENVGNIACDKGEWVDF